MFGANDRVLPCANDGAPDRRRPRRHADANNHIAERADRAMPARAPAVRRGVARTTNAWRALALTLLAPLLALLAPSLSHAAGRLLVLSDADERTYREAFDAAERGRMNEAQDALEHISDQSLAGHVYARAFLRDGARPNYKALVTWLQNYNDQPFADMIRARAVARAPRGASVPPVAPAPARRNPLGGSTPPGDNAAARQAIANAYEAFSTGDINGAVRYAESQVNGPRSGPAHWHLGLIAFQQHDYRAAAAHFDAAAAWPHHDAWNAAATRYWAGRAHLAAGNPTRALAQFESALRYPATFYGQLAEAQLGRSSGLQFVPPSIDAPEAAAFIARHKEARRAAALAQIGRLSDVEKELQLLHARINPDEDRIFLDFADALAAPSAQLRVAEYGGAMEGWGYCPTMSFAPENGWRFDRAALFAVTRQESRYSPIAISSSNARGLMQLLPSTATDMDKSKPFRRQPDMLHDPGLNMRLGQAYLEWLMQQVARDGDLAKLFAAYNGGPGWLSRHLAANPDLRDPLMMIESLPRAESRDYAERVLSHMGLCRKRLNQDSAEFLELASGKPATYVKLDRP